MVLSRQVRQQIEKQDFDTVELEWLEQMEASPDQVGYFTSVARALVGAGQSPRAKMLLDLLDEQLSSSGQWQIRLELLKGTGKIRYSPNKLHAALVQTLTELYADTVAFERLMETVGLDRRTSDPDKTWNKVARLESLLRFDEGTIVYMAEKGVGRVIEVNHKLESFKIEIQGKGTLRVGFRAAGKVLEPLPKGHILARKVNDPESLATLSPSDLLAELLRGFDRPLTVAEVRDALYGLISPQRWNTWWAAARKHPQIVAGHQIRNSYRWVESLQDAHGAIWKTFESASPRSKLELLRRNTSHDRRLRDRMIEALQRLGHASVRRGDPGLGFEIWHRLEKAGTEPAGGDGQAYQLVESMADPLRLFATIDSRSCRDRAYGLIREVRSDWTDVYRRALMAEGDAKLIALLCDALQQQSPDVYRKSVDRCLAQPNRSAGFFTWLAEAAAEDEAFLEKWGVRLFKKMLDALATEEFSSYRARLLKLCDSGGTLPRLLPHFHADDAEEAELAVKRASRLARDQRERLLNALQLRFPSLRTADKAPLYALPSSIRAKRAELKSLLEVEIPNNRKAIQEAREQGDLRENFEYKAARQRHEYLTAFATSLNQDLTRSQALDLKKIDCVAVSVGTEIRLLGSNQSEKLITILGPWESSPEQGIVSYESDVARSLLGRRQGDEVEMSSTIYKIASIAIASASSENAI